MKKLIPIRYGQMLQSPFAFYRGAAGIMAADLARTPNTGLKVQTCGDCHLLNFGGFATPERSIIFDINDFDETVPGPWEWDASDLSHRSCWPPERTGCLTATGSTPREPPSDRSGGATYARALGAPNQQKSQRQTYDPLTSTRTQPVLTAAAPTAAPPTTARRVCRRATPATLTGVSGRPTRA